MNEYTLTWMDADAAAGAVRAALNASRDARERYRLERALHALKEAQRIVIDDTAEEAF